MNTNYEIEFKRDGDEDIHLLEEKLYAHNSTAIGAHDGALFSALVKNEKKEVVAGIGGWTWAGACEITQLWVHESERKNGLGKKLLGMAETEARNKGCRHILVKSYSFQAPHFYEKNGYEIKQVIANFPYGHDYYTLVKTIH
jgi:GNAT superfamily N-acetyltransferase